MGENTTSAGASDLEGGWSTLPGCEEPAERIEFENLDLLDELAHPIRSRIMRQLKGPKSIAEVALSLDMPVTRLYHHINRLERAGLIRLVGTRKVAAVIERRYQVVAHTMGVEMKFFESGDPAEVATALGSIFDMAKLGLQQQIESGALQLDESDDTTVISFGHLTLSAERMVELHDRLTDLIDEFSSDKTNAAPDATKVALFIAAHPESD